MFFLLLIFSLIEAQEFEATVDVNISQLAGADVSLFQELRQKIFEFINTTKFTTIDFKENEKIKVSFFLNVDQVKGPNTYGGFLQVNYSRPVYGSGYLSPVFTIRDENITFTWVKGQSFIFSEVQYTADNLPSIVAFYLYLILGLDFDTYSLEGGTPYYEKARQIAINAQNSGDAGWSPSDKKQRNRYWLINLILTDEAKPFRRFLYEYHRLALDSMHIAPEAMLNKTLLSLQYLYEMNKARPNNILLQYLFEAKNGELAQIFEPAPPPIRTNFLQIVETIDPAHTSRYRQKK